MSIQTEQLLTQAFAHHQAGRLPEAESLYREILRQDPRDANALHLLGVAAQQDGRNEEAVRLIRQAIALFPHGPAFHNNLGNALKATGDLEEARLAYLQALHLQPDYLEAQSNLGLVLHALKRWDEALTLFQAALALLPDNPVVLNNLGVTLNLLGRLEEAAEALKRSVVLDPNQPEAHNNLANILYDHGDLEAANVHTRKALELRPNYATAHSSLVFRLNYEVNQSREALFEAHQEWARQHEVPFLAEPPHFEVSREIGRRLRVGYVSSDFRAHSVAFFFEPLLAAHDPSAVEIFCYAQVPNPDDVTRRMMKLAGHWRNIVGQSDEVVSAMIREDRIDVLVDLTGHTGNNRLPVFARRPAPVLVNWLGYPNTTGMASFSARFTDAITDPDGEESIHSEPLYRLPRGFLCYRPNPESPAVVALPASGGKPFTFGSFNSLLKVNVSVIAAWAEILERTPGTRLLMKGMLQRDAATRARFERIFQAHGVDLSRIELMPALASTHDHLAVYGQVDLALDPFPYNGTTTTCEALWMGVPTLTLHGNRHAGRVGSSIMHRVGLDEFVAPDLASYVNQAVGWTSRVGELARLREGLRERTAASDLCDAKGFASQVEDAYRELWSAWVQSQ